jgi:hypothetical protein
MGDAERLRNFEHVDQSLLEMCNAIAELGCIRTGGGNWCGHARVHQHAFIEEQLARVADLYMDGSATDTADSLQVTFVKLRSYVFDRVVHAPDSDLELYATAHEMDVAEARALWEPYARRHEQAMRRLMRNPLVRNRDRGAVEILRVAESLVQAFVDINPLPAPHEGKQEAPGRHLTCCPATACRLVDPVATFWGS